MTQFNAGIDKNSPDIAGPPPVGAPPVQQEDTLPYDLQVLSEQVEEEDAAQAAPSQEEVIATAVAKAVAQMMPQQPPVVAGQIPGQPDPNQPPPIQNQFAVEPYGERMKAQYQQEAENIKALVEDKSVPLTAAEIKQRARDDVSSMDLSEHADEDGVIPPYVKSQLISQQMEQYNALASEREQQIQAAQYKMNQTKEQMDREGTFSHELVQNGFLTKEAVQNHREMIGLKAARGDLNQYDYAFAGAFVEMFQADPVSFVNRVHHLLAQTGRLPQQQQQPVPSPTTPYPPQGLGVPQNQPTPYPTGNPLSGNPMSGRQMAPPPQMPGGGYFGAGYSTPGVPSGGPGFATETQQPKYQTRLGANGRQVSVGTQTKKLW